MNGFTLYLWFLFGVFVKINAQHETDWKPIVGPNVPQSLPLTLQPQQPISSRVFNTASRSRSTITFNGQTITTNIGDIGTNDAAGSVLAADSPDLNSDIDTEPHYVGYNDGKILNGFLTAAAPQSDECSVEKYAFEDEGTIQYQVGISKMEEFTLCAWTRFTNHNGDHSIFTYSVDGEPREIQFWIANSKGSSYFSLAVHGQTLFRLNYPLKLRQWHHACASWNGKTGEWQLWVKAERVGRGFHNRLVDHIMPGNGVAYSGGPSITGAIAPGHHMEITVLQLYKVALSAGKAHRDHKHHHVHRFDYDGLVPSSPQPTPSPQQTTPNPFLANGPVLNRVNFAAPPQPPANIFPAAQPLSVLPALQGLQPQQFPGQSQFSGQAQFPGQAPFPGRTQFMNGQYSGAQRLVQDQFTPPPPTSSPSPTAPVLFPNDPQQIPTIPESITSSSSFMNLNNPANVQFIDDDDARQTFGNRILFKRNDNSAAASTKTGTVTVMGGTRKMVKVKRIVRTTNGKKINKKRALVALSDGSIIDDKNIDAAIGNNEYVYDGLSQFGADDYQENLAKQDNIEDEIKEHDREPAEEEVNAVLSLCSACQVEPFVGAVALAWKGAKIIPEKVLKGQSVGGCGTF